jgi:putative Mg2+ transporter-C (MgtC) family protein
MKPIILFQDLDLMEISLRIFFSIIAGSLIGLERLWHHKEAGLKTNTLVCMGATIFGMISTNSSALPLWSASQFSAGIITGVGFLGSGIILQRNQHIQGVNSAATIWVSAGLGLACGVGQYGLAIVALVAVLVVQFFHRWVESKVPPTSGKP